MQSAAVKKTLFLVLLAMLVLSAVELDSAEAGQKADLIFVKGKFIKKDKKGVIVIEEKEHCGCKGHGRR